MSSLSRRASRVFLVACMGMACVGAPPPPPGGDGSDATGSSGTTMAVPVTTTLPEDGSGSTGSSTSSSTSGGDTTTSSTSTSSDETTKGVEPTETGSSESTTGEPLPPECAVPEECPNNETCDGGQCVPTCNPWGPNDYAYCVTPLGTFDSATICGEALSCINATNGVGDIASAVCGRSCNSACDCPAPAATGNATVTCGNLVAGGSNECYLSCANGETCPDGMECLMDAMGNPSYCAYPVQPILPYGNCDNMAAGCVAGYTCAVSGTHSVCTGLCPGGIAECEPALPGAASAAACDPVISPPDGIDCHMPCSSNLDCPNGMGCIDGLLCMWP